MSDNDNATNNPTPRPQADAIVTRRDFIALLVGAGVSVGAAAVLADPIANFLTPPVPEDEHSRVEGGGHDVVGSSPHHWVMVIDLSKCVGCDYCVYACQATNDTTEDMRWNVRLVDETPQGDIFHVTRPCLHCNNAPCVRVCPVSATYSRADGIVVMDYDRCIGCRYCQTACPYGARVFNWEERGDEPNPYAPEFGTPEIERRVRGVVEKCTFCIHRIDAALLEGKIPGEDAEATPACINICPVNARFFGDLNDPHSEVSRIIENNATLRLREDLGTAPNVYYIPPEDFVT